MRIPVLWPDATVMLWPDGSTVYWFDGQIVSLFYGVPFPLSLAYVAPVQVSLFYEPGDR